VPDPLGRLDLIGERSATSGMGAVHRQGSAFISDQRAPAIVLRISVSLPQTVLQTGILRVIGRRFGKQGFISAVRRPRMISGGLDQDMNEAAAACTDHPGIHRGLVRVARKSPPVL
jgi:hypothetical protein